MLGLLLASIWVWAIIVGFGRRIGRLRRTSEKFESDFWKADDIDAFHRLHKDSALPIARVFGAGVRSEEHTSELPSLMRISYAVFCLKKKKQTTSTNTTNT